MELEVSAWTRRDRLERIAAAERDRRAGRTGLALAAVGAGGEWPARLVLALAKLPEDEGADARAILEAALDDWASQSSLGSLDPDAATPEAAPAPTAPTAPTARTAPTTPASPTAPIVQPEVVVAEPAEGDQVELSAAEREASEDGGAPSTTGPARHERDLVGDAVDTLDEDLLAAPSAPRVADAPETRVDAEACDAGFEGDALERPIEIDELERAFAEAEAQTDEMHDVNEVAERVLSDEPIGLAELVGDVDYVRERDDLHDRGGGGDRNDPGDPDDEIEEAGSASSLQTDAAWASAPIWPEPSASEPPRGETRPGPAEERRAEDVDPPRAEVIATLERWLENIRARGAQ